ncbi:MAG: hypothetical protein HC915_12155 [Anaerolineae bacterium]|nr:hypothetical protein [Anaerolineae bacterium]
MLRFVHISDTHVGPDATFTLYEQNTLASLEALITHLNEELPFAPDFVLHTGDVIDMPNAASTQLAAQALARLRYPIYYAIGNHDSRAQVRAHLLGQPPSEDPLCYDFVANGVHFIVLDSLRAGEPQPSGELGTAQLAWLAAQLEGSEAQSVAVVVAPPRRLTRRSNGCRG